jgi:hypothetical protein
MLGLACWVFTDRCINHYQKSSGQSRVGSEKLHAHENDWAVNYVSVYALNARLESTDDTLNRFITGLHAAYLNCEISWV